MVPVSHDWDSYGVYAPSVLYDGHVYSMWYSGYDYVGNPPSEGISQIGYATSLDGVTWSRAAGNPILGPGSDSHWDSNGGDHPCVIEVKPGTFRLYYTGYASANQALPNEIGFADSPAGFVLPELVSPMIGATIAIALAPGAIALAKRRRRET